MFKIRVISSNSKYQDNPYYGISMPREIAVFFKDTFFSIRRSGTSIILTSGCQEIYSTEDIKKYKFEDVRV